MVLTAGMKRNTIHILTAVAGLTLMAARATGADTASRMTGIGPSFKGPIGLQLYSLRDQFAKDMRGTLAQTRDFGFQFVELAGTYGQPAVEFKQLLAEHGLKPVSGHFPYERFRDDVDGIAREAKILGLEYAGCAWIPHKDDFDEQECREAIAVFNRAGEALAKQGLKFFYHIHGYEFVRRGSGTLFDVMMAETKLAYVSFELDVLWAVFPGQDPVKCWTNTATVGRWSI